MTNPTGIINGTKLLLLKGLVPIGAMVSNSQAFNRSLIEITNKDSQQHREMLIDNEGANSVDISCECVFTTNSAFLAMRDAFFSGSIDEYSIAINGVVEANSFFAKVENFSDSANLNEATKASFSLKSSGIVQELIAGGGGGGGGGSPFDNYVAALAPLVFYPLNETSGELMTDMIGNLNGSYSVDASLMTTTSDTGNAITNFSETNTASTVDSPIFDNPTQFTVYALFTTGNVVDLETVFAKSDKAIPSGSSWRLLTSTSKITFEWEEFGSNKIITSNLAPLPNTKYMVHCRWTGTQWSIFVNGVKQNDFWDHVGQVDSSVVGITVGSRSNATHTEFQGSVDHAAYFDRALTDQEILDKYNEYIA